jgi:hypothetical protein
MVMNAPNNFLKDTVVSLQTQEWYSVNMRTTRITIGYILHMGTPELGVGGLTNVFHRIEQIVLHAWHSVIVLLVSLIPT